MGTLSLIASLFDGSGKTQHRLARLWAKSLLAFSFIRVRVEGIEKLDPNASYVFVSNHESLMDIPAILSRLPFQFRFFAKKGLFGIPFLGTHLKRAGHLPVDRSNARSFAEEHERGRAHRRRARYLGAAVPGGRPLAGRPARVQGRRGLHRDQGRRAGGADGDCRDASAAADGLDPHSLGTASACESAAPIPTAGMKVSDREELTRRLYQEISAPFGGRKLLPLHFQASDFARGIDAERHRPGVRVLVRLQRHDRLLAGFENSLIDRHLDAGQGLRQRQCHRRRAPCW